MIMRRFLMEVLAAKYILIATKEHACKNDLHWVGIGVNGCLFKMIESKEVIKLLVVGKLCNYDATSVFGIELKVLKALVSSPSYDLLLVLRLAHTGH